MAELKQFITEAFDKLNRDKDLISDAYDSFKSRLEKLVEKEGGIFE